MAFNKISLNKVDAQNVSQIGIFPAFPINDVINQFDIFYHLGTDLQQTTFTNPITLGDVAITMTGGIIEAGSLPSLTDRLQNTSVRFTAPGDVTVQIEFLNNFEVDLHSYIMTTSTALTGWPLAWILEASNDAITWTKLDQVTSSGFTTVNQETLFYCESRLGFFKYFRFRNFTWGGSDELLTEVMFFGKLRNLVTGQAALENTKDIFASYPDIAANNRHTNQILRYDGTYWEPRIRFPFEIIKLNLSNNYTITSAYKPTFYVVSPGGANRVITLPTSPNKDDVVKIKNVDGAYDITVEEFVGDPSPVILSNAGKLQYEFVYDGTSNWIVTG